MLADYTIYNNSPSGERIVENYLFEKGVYYTTQYCTLKCINLKTGFVLPYDFELPDDKIIIEVQGAQHVKFSEQFHRDQSDFDNQQYRDKVKKEFALSKGYKFVEIFYDEIYSGSFKKKINKALKK